VLKFRLALLSRADLGVVVREALEGQPVDVGRGPVVLRVPCEQWSLFGFDRRDMNGPPETTGCPSAGRFGKVLSDLPSPVAYCPQTCSGKIAFCWTLASTVG